jgi:predicted metal-dependent phosphoesterase TrpH
MDFYKKAGYDGVVITDHFLGGSNIINKDIPWEEKVYFMERGYKNALERGKEIGLDVFYGWEFSFHGTDLLCYGLDTDWLLKNPECDKLTLNEYCDIAHESGGFIVHAHPFREAHYIDMIRLLPRKVDGVEIINACRTDFENKLAKEYAENYGLLKICGSDNHRGIQSRLAVFELEKRAESIFDIIDAVKEEKHKISLYSTDENGIPKEKIVE